MLKFIDIGANLTDPMFKGIYNGSQKHQDDLKQVLERSWKSGVEKIIITCGSLAEINATVELANLDERLFRTVGCHPTRCGEVEEMGEKKYFEVVYKYLEADINKNNNLLANNNNNNNNNINNSNNNNNRNINNISNNININSNENVNNKNNNKKKNVNNENSDNSIRHIATHTTNNTNNDDKNNNNNNNNNNNKSNNSKNVRGDEINTDGGDDTDLWVGLDSGGSGAIEPQRKVVAIGECGLDYERLQFCPKETQLKYLPHHLSLSTTFDLPLFLHCRAAHLDLISAIRNHPHPLSGVVHSYDGSLDHALQLINLGMSIGINGCSLRTAENLEVVKSLPLDKILVETDAPWCEIKASHASHPFLGIEAAQHVSVKKEKWKEGCMVKGRNEPANVRQVVEVVAAVKGEALEKVAHQIYLNTTSLFRLTPSS